MTKEIYQYHGLVLANIIHECDSSIKIKKCDFGSNAAYVLNDNTGIYLKYSSKRLSPWRFTFLKSQQDILLEMRSKFKHLFLTLICGKDEIVVLDWNETKVILDSIHEDSEWMAVSRTKGTMYSLSGSDGKLYHKIAKNDFPKKILQSISL